MGSGILWVLTDMIKDVCKARHRHVCKSGPVGTYKGRGGHSAGDVDVFACVFLAQFLQEGEVVGGIVGRDGVATNALRVGVPSTNSTLQR